MSEAYTTSPKVRGSELALKEACNKLIGIVKHCNIAWDSQMDEDGTALHHEVCRHIDLLNEGLSYWEESIRHYNSLKGE